MRSRRSEGVSMLRHSTVTRVGRLGVALAAMLGIGGTAALQIGGLGAPSAAASTAVTPTIWVVNQDGNTLLSYPLSATGDATPAVTISANATSLERPLRHRGLRRCRATCGSPIWTPARSSNTPRASSPRPGTRRPPSPSRRMDRAWIDPGSVAFDRSGDLWALNEGGTACRVHPEPARLLGSPDTRRHHLGQHGPLRVRLRWRRQPVGGRQGREHRGRVHPEPARLVGFPDAHRHPLGLRQPERSRLRRLRRPLGDEFKRGYGRRVHPEPACGVGCPDTGCHGRVERIEPRWPLQPCVRRRRQPVGAELQQQQHRRVHAEPTRRHRRPDAGQHHRRWQHGNGRTRWRRDRTGPDGVFGGAQRRTGVGRDHGDDPWHRVQLRLHRRLRFDRSHVRHGREPVRADGGVSGRKRCRKRDGEHVRGTSATSSADQFTYASSGYTLAGSDGGTFALGTAPFLGSLPADGVHA